ncbi:MAG: hypothetical protein PHY54_19790 [Methylococcales bacterium]|nr:hypothetical protein [Methylococcales bacterium]
MKSLLAVLLLTSSINASADTANGAMIGISNAMQTWAAQDAEREREAKQQQYEIARQQRIEAAIQEQRNQQAEFERQNALRQKAYQDQAQARAVELYHQQ